MREETVFSRWYLVRKRKKLRFKVKLQVLFEIFSAVFY